MVKYHCEFGCEIDVGLNLEGTEFETQIEMTNCIVHRSKLMNEAEFKILQKERKRNFLIILFTMLIIAIILLSIMYFTIIKMIK